MARTKRPPIMHIPFVAPVVTGADPNLQSQIDSAKVHTPKLSDTKNPTVREKSPEINFSPSTSLRGKAPAPLGVTECPHCEVDLRNMAVADVRNHVESCGRPTTAGSETSELSEPPESPTKESADQLEGEEDESDLESLSDLDILEGEEEYDFDDLPGAYEDEESSSTPNENSISDVKFPKLRDSNEILASLDDIESMTPREAHRRTANVASVLDTIQSEWMSLERETAKAASGDGTPMIRNPRAAREKMTYQDRLEADVYGYAHNPHPTLLGRQDPIAQRQGSDGNDQIRSRLRKPTKKAAGDMDYNFDIGESSRPTRTRNTPNRYESESREQTPSGIRKPRGRGKGGRIGELRSEHDPRSQGARTGSPLAFESTNENGLQSLSSLRDKALASTEVDEGESGANSRPTTRSSSSSVPQDDGVKRSAGKKHGHASENEGDSTAKPNKKARTKTSSGDGDANTSEGKKKTRQKQMVRDEDGQLRTKQSVMMAARWKAFRENPTGPRIGRRPGSEKAAGSDARSSRKRSLGESSDPVGAIASNKKRKTSKDDRGRKDTQSEQTTQAPVKGKRGGKRANSGRKPAKGSGFGAKRQPRSSDGQLDDHPDNDDHAETPDPLEEGELLQPSSGSTRASTRPRKPTVAKQEADDKKPRGQWGGKREKGKRNDGSLMARSKELTPGAPIPLEEGMVADSDQSDDNNDESASEGQDDDMDDHEEEVDDEDAEGENDDATPAPTRKNKKHGKGVSNKASQRQPSVDDYPDLPIYDKNNPSAEYKALSKNLKMKAVSRARWASGHMHHMFGQKGPNKTTKEKITASEATSNTGGANSARTSVSATRSVPPSVRRRPTSRHMGDVSDEHEIDKPPASLRRKISEYEEFQALASPSLNPDGEGKRRRRPAAMRASTSFLEPNTSSDFEDEENGDETGHDNGPNGRKSRKEKEKSKNGSSSTGRKGVGGRPPRIQTDIADTASVMRGSGGGSAVNMTAYEEFQALSAPGSPMVLPKRKRKSILRGGEMVDTDEYYEYNDDE